MVGQTDNLAGYHDLGSFHVMPTFEATLSGFSNVFKHAN